MALESKTINYRDIHYECSVAGMKDDDSALNWLNSGVLNGDVVIDGIHILNWSTSTTKSQVSSSADLSQIKQALSYDRDYVSAIIVKCKYKSRPIKIELDLEDYVVNIFVRRNSPIDEMELLKVLKLD